MLSFVSGSKDSGYLEEEKTDYVHGLATIESTKDVASGKYLKKPSSVKDTAIFNNKNFNQQSSSFNYGNNIYKRSEAYYAFATKFTDDLWLGQFKSDGGDAVAGYVPFIDVRYVILPVIYGSYKKLQNLTDNLDFIAAEEAYLKNDYKKALVLYEKIKSDDLMPNEINKITSKIADLKKKIEEEKKKIEDDIVNLNFELYPYADGFIHCAAGPTAIVNVTNPKTGRIWMDRNLGASQVATSSDDSKAYGDFYQWGRRADGHQCRTSPTTATLSSIDQPSHGNFILATSAPYDWRSPQTVNLWQGVNGVNNPCPSTYRLPTMAELNAERASWFPQNSAGAFSSPLKWTLAGFRNSNSSLGFVGTDGYYWSSTVGVAGVYSTYMNFSFSSNATFPSTFRANGMSVRCIKDLSPSVTTINCAGATTYTSGTTINSGSQLCGVSVTVPYTGGNGGDYGAQSISSTGVLGLTATLSASVLTVGNSSVSYTISGTPSSSGIASFTITLGGQSCTFTVSVAAATQYAPCAVNCAAGATAVVNVTNPTTGRIWMDRNLGAIQVATNSNDINAYGDLYQWGRRTDGHQCRTSPTTATLSSVDEPAHGSFILAPNFPYDWRSPQNVNLWQGVNGVNNPCPSTYRVPTSLELDAERLSWSSQNSAGAFSSPLKWAVGGYRFYGNASLTSVGTDGYYWSSTVSGGNALKLLFSSSVSINSDIRGSGLSVRCIKN